MRVRRLDLARPIVSEKPRGHDARCPLLQRLRAKNQAVRIPRPGHKIRQPMGQSQPRQPGARHHRDTRPIGIRPGLQEQAGTIVAPHGSIPDPYLPTSDLHRTPGKQTCPGQVHVGVAIHQSMPEGILERTRPVWALRLQILRTRQRPLPVRLLESQKHRLRPGLNLQRFEGLSVEFHPEAHRSLAPTSGIQRESLHVAGRGRHPLQPWIPKSVHFTHFQRTFPWCLRLRPAPSPPPSPHAPTGLSHSPSPRLLRCQTPRRPEGRVP